MVPYIRLLLYIRNNFSVHRSMAFSLSYSREMKLLADGQQSVLSDDVFQSENRCAGGAQICRSVVVDIRR